MDLKMSDCKEFVEKRNVNSNKGDFGYIAILGGCINYSGAVKLANLSSSAIRAGAGVTRLIVPKSISNSILPYLLESTLYPIEDKDGFMLFNEKEIEKSLNKIDALAIGMGWGKSEGNKKILSYILENYSIPIVIDADGLNTLAEMDLELLKNTKSKIILTPHPKEFERLSKINIEEILKNPVKIAENFAREYNVSVAHIVELNDISNPNLIYPGEKLRITESNIQTLSPIPKNSYSTYTVQRGDNLSRIARRFGVTVNYLVSVNNIQNPNLIFPGQILIV